MESLEKKAKAENAINIHANDISSPKTTHGNNDMRVTSISNIAVDDSEEISIVSPVNESNKNGTHSSVNEPYHISVGHNTCKTRSKLNRDYPNIAEIRGKRTTFHKNKKFY